MKQQVDFKWQDVPKFSEGWDSFGRLTHVDLGNSTAVFTNDDNNTKNVLLNLRTLKQLHQLSTGKPLSYEVRNYIISNGLGLEQVHNFAPGMKVHGRRFRPTNGQILDYVLQHKTELEQKYMANDRTYLVRTRPKKSELLGTETTVPEAYLIGSAHYSIIPSAQVKAFFDGVLGAKGMQCVRTQEQYKSLVLTYEVPNSEPISIGNESFNKYFAIVVGRNDGTLSIRVYFGVQALGCTNQLLFKRSKIGDDAIWLRISHYEKKTAPLDRIKVMIEKSYNGFDDVFRAIETAMNKDIQRPDQIKLIKELEKNYRISKEESKLIQIRLGTESATLWGVTQAMTWVATHSDALSDSQKTDLRSYAGRMLQYWNTIENLEDWKYTDMTERTDGETLSEIGSG